MADRNDYAIVDALEAMTNVLAWENETLQENQNQNAGADVFYELRKFQKNKPPTFKVIYDPDGAQSCLHEMEKVFQVIGYTSEILVSDMRCPR